MAPPFLRPAFLFLVLVAVSNAEITTWHQRLILSRYGSGPPARLGDLSNINLQIFNCDESNDRQLWTLSPHGSGVIVHLTHPTTSQAICLDSNGANIGQSPHTWDCDLSNPNENQVWTYNSSTGALCSLAVPTSCLSATVNMTETLTWFQTFHGNGLDQWTYAAGQFVNDATKPSSLSEMNSTLCLDVGSRLKNRSCADADLKDKAFCNTSLPAVERAQSLVKQMTPLEKPFNLQNSNPGLARDGVSPFQFNEALHGIVSTCGAVYQGNTGCPTSFPHALALGATFNASLWRTIGHTISNEGRALHNQGIVGLAFWAPDINLFRDPRWGRGQEVPGEDPFLTSEYVMHWSRGMQEGEDTKYLKVVSTGKHFADYDQEGNHGVDRGAFNAVVTDKDQVEYYWPAWRAAVEGAHVQSIMCSYNAVNSVPSCGHNLFMNVVARGEWQFDGFFVSDCGAIGDPAFTAYVKQHYNGSELAQAALGLTAGCDLNCGSYYAEHVAAAVKAGVLKESVVDEALVRVWSRYIQLGMLDPPSSSVYNNLGPQDVDTPAHRALALEAAQQAIVLLKNDKDLLPLSKSTKLAVLGPHFNATQDMLSIYRGTNTLVNSHSPLDALSKMGTVVASAQGCALASNDTSGFAAAVEAAKKAQVAVVFVGLHPGQGGGSAREDEGWDRLNLTFPGVQLQLVQAIVQTGVPTVVVMINGGPLDTTWIKANAAALVEAFYPGELGGDAIASVLLGDVSPSGRLPTTHYDESLITARPTIMDMSLTNNGGITYRYYTGTPVFPFGFGMSYTTFSINWTSTSAAQFKGMQNTSTHQLKAAHPRYYARRLGQVDYGAPIYEVVVKNTGSRYSAVSVLGFVTSSHEDAPLKELFGFGRVALHPGESATIYLSVPPQVLSLVDKNGVETLRPGTYTLSFEGPHPTEPLVGQLHVSGPPVQVFSLPEMRQRDATSRFAFTP